MGLRTGVEQCVKDCSSKNKRMSFLTKYHFPPLKPMRNKTKEKHLKQNAIFN